ncbi:hypothetical protein [Rhizobium sp. BK068]|uniref:hypothetical protein n=1 Tax=Rhizobium sp. BK068 TaxID=2512130 RepID=UPI001047CF3B|nr:hypothetical protein [Rhizobium sp. BK068]TCM78618.1 hypothetical protein EV291_105240 [Rhizobium sp. BK068]
MMSFLESAGDSDLFTLEDPKAEAVTDFVTEVGERLQQAFLHRKRDSKLTQQEIARQLDVDRSRVHRCLSGYHNLTLETVAELVWAMKGRPEFRIVLDEDDDAGCNFSHGSLGDLSSAVRLVSTSDNTKLTPPSAASMAVSGHNHVHLRPAK